MVTPFKHRFLVNLISSSALLLGITSFHSAYADDALCSDKSPMCAKPTPCRNKKSSPPCKKKCSSDTVTRAEFNALKAQVDQKVQTGSHHPGSLRLPGTETDVHFYGMIRGNALYDAGIPAAGANYLYVYANAIPLQTPGLDDNKRGQTIFSARESRIGFEAFNQTSWGDISGHLEIDFLGYAPDAYNPQVVTNTSNARWRVAYLSLNQFLIGQAPTNFYSLREVAKSLDLAHGSGIGANRQMQVRYTKSWNDLTYAVSAEAPETEYISHTGVKFFTNKPGAGKTSSYPTLGTNRIPDLVAKVDWSPCPTLNLGAGFVWRHLTLRAPASKSVNAYGIGLNGHITLNHQTTFMWQVMGGDGIGRYILDAAGQGAFYNASTGDFKTQKAYGGLIALEHQWTPQLSSTIIGGMTRIKNDPYLRSLSAAQAANATAGGINKAMYSLHANTIWSPFGEMLDIGLGYTYAIRRVEDGRHGTSNRFMFSVSYKFGQPSHKSSHHHLPDAG